ncbi:MAG: hypothetical protein Q8M16_06490 [Pirellulaceae bacterium]|nr:hypothetical protein [Pirellulaceae bacterium]
MLSNAQIRVAHSYGIFAILLSLVMLCFALGESLGFFVRPMDLTGVTFAGCAIFAIPFVITYTSLGLNSAEGEQETPETKLRHKLLKSACPWWHPSWYVCIGVIVLSWILGATLKIRLDVFVIFGSMLMMLSGIWFLTVYCTAHRVLTGDAAEEETD